MRTTNIFSAGGVVVMLWAAGSLFDPQDAPKKHCPAVTPPEVASHFFDAITSADINEAMRLSEPPVGVPEFGLREEYKMLFELAQDRIAPEIVAHLQLENAAIVIIRDSAPDAAFIDLDPVYLFQRDDRWKVFFEGSKFDDHNFNLDDKVLSRFHTLRNWYQDQTPNLQQMLKVSADEDENP